MWWFLIFLVYVFAGAIGCKQVLCPETPKICNVATYYSYSENWSQFQSRVVLQFVVFREIRLLTLNSPILIFLIQCLEYAKKKSFFNMRAILLGYGVLLLLCFVKFLFATVRCMLLCNKWEARYHLHMQTK